jgi:hypothetical protein
MRITRKHGVCSDGTCPAIYDTDDPELVAVQGSTLTDAQALSDLGELPGHESVVLLPRSLFESYSRGGHD